MIDKPLMLEPNVTNIVDIRGMTHSGRVFTPEKKRNIPKTSSGKEVSNSNTEIGPSKGEITQKEVGEYLRIIKRSDYKEVNQLGKTPSKISIYPYYRVLRHIENPHWRFLMKLMSRRHNRRPV